jgi:hypothetical protein
MDFDDITEFRLIRVNPFQGLVIDSDTWHDAHEYHRNHQRLHMLAFHNTGIIGGLKVIASDPVDRSVNIQSGMAVDSKGNVIIVPETQHYIIQTQENCTIYLIIQFREVPIEPYQPPEGGQPTRILEAYRIQEREKLPDESHLELCRINLEPATKAIRDASDSSKPAKNEIDLRFRQASSPKPKIPMEKLPTDEKVTIPVEENTNKKVENITIGHAVLTDTKKDIHVAGLQNLIKEINRQGNLVVQLEKNISLDQKINKYSIIYLTGNGGFTLTNKQEEALSEFLHSGGTIFGEGCTEDPQEISSKSSKEFGLAFNQLASILKCKLEIVERGHPLLSACHVFAEAPQGAEAPMLLEGGHMIYSASDYGCAWQGGHLTKPLPRDIIRGAFEIGLNIIKYNRS